MTREHWAGSEHWAETRRRALKGISPDAQLRELRCRIEALEGKRAIITPSTVEVPPGSLMERLGEVWSEGHLLHPYARAAVIRTVAQWVRDRYPESPEAHALAFNLCQEIAPAGLQPPSAGEEPAALQAPTQQARQRAVSIDTPEGEAHP